MKLFSAAPKTSRTAARNAVLLNLFATPGLGSLLARHWLAGLGQLAVFLAGFWLFCEWSFQQFNLALALFNGADAVPPGNGHLALIGFALAALAWLWSLGTSLQILRAAKKTAAAPPPVLAATTWQKTGQVISRRFEFADFTGAMKFVNGVAALAEAAGHHPDMDIRWNKVTLSLTTHDAGGLTDKDYALALACDELYARRGDAG